MSALSLVYESLPTLRALPPVARVIPLHPVERPTEAPAPWMKDLCDILMAPDEMDIPVVCDGCNGDRFRMRRGEKIMCPDCRPGARPFWEA